MPERSTEVAIPRPSEKVEFSAPLLQEKTSKGVNVETELFRRQDQRWDLIDALMSRTTGMRARGKRFLPTSSHEEHDNYKFRRRVSHLLPAYSNTSDVLISLPFVEPMTREGEAPDFISHLYEDADLKGRSFDDVASRSFGHGVHYGKSLALVDHTRLDRPMSRADRSSGVFRPYIRRIHPRNLIGWRWGVGEKGEPNLSQIRFRKKRIAHEDFNEVCIDQVEVWTAAGSGLDGEGTVQTWERIKESDEFRLTQEVPMPLLEVPLAYSVLCEDDDGDDLTSRPCLEDLADLCHAHWIQWSWQTVALIWGRTLLAIFSGVTKEELKDQGGVVMGAAKFLAFANPEAKASFLEHNGHALEAGHKEIERIEQRIEAAGAKPFHDPSGNRTATEVRDRSKKSDSPFSKWLTRFENGMISKSWRFAAMWASVDLPDDFEMKIPRDALQSFTGDDAKLLLDSAMSGKISTEIYLKELRRRRILANSPELSEHIERVAANELP